MRRLNTALLFFWHTFREALTTWEANRREGIEADPLQRYHTLHNLAQLLDDLFKPSPHSTRSSAAASGIPRTLRGSARGAVSGIPRTLRDSALQQQAEDIRRHYLGQRSLAMAQVQSEYVKGLKTVPPDGELNLNLNNFTRAASR